jgi:uncharacterized membrane protein
MGKTWIIIIGAVLVVIGGVAWYIGPLIMGEPKLRVEFSPDPPWQVQAGTTLEFMLYIANDGSGIAREVVFSMRLPEGFTHSITGSRQFERHFSSIHPGDGVSHYVTISVSDKVLPGHYNIEIKISGANVPEQNVLPVVKVLSSD